MQATPIPADAVNHRQNCIGADVRAIVGRKGDPGFICNNCGVYRFGDGPTPGRYQINCVRCDRVISLDSPKPGVPLCAQCKHRGASR